MVQSIAKFYDPRLVQRAFGASGDYTIVEGRHIGIDQGTNKQAIDVPALLPGKVVSVIPTHSILGSVVVVDVGVLAPWGRRVYLSYCHLSKDRLPAVGASLRAGDRVGRLAAGPNKGANKVPSWHVEWPGSSWGGIHLHLVAGFHPRSAHERVSGHRTLQMFIDPADLVWRVLSGAPAGGNSTPLEEDDMNPDERAALFQIREELRELLPGKAGVRNQGDTNKVLVDTLTTARAAKAEAEAAKKAAEALVDDFTPGQAGVRHAGRLIKILSDILGKPTASVDAAAAKTIASAIVEQLPKQSGGGVTKAEIEAAVVAGVRRVLTDGVAG